MYSASEVERLSLIQHTLDHQSPAFHISPLAIAFLYIKKGTSPSFWKIQTFTTSLLALRGNVWSKVLHLFYLSLSSRSLSLSLSLSLSAAVAKRFGFLILLEQVHNANLRSVPVTGLHEMANGSQLGHTHINEWDSCKSQSMILYLSLSLCFPRTVLYTSTSFVYFRWVFVTWEWREGKNFWTRSFERCGWKHEKA